jgi:hypothetical protein
MGRVGPPRPSSERRLPFRESRRSTGARSMEGRGPVVGRARSRAQRDPCQGRRFVYSGRDGVGVRHPRPSSFFWGARAAAAFPRAPPSPGARSMWRRRPGVGRHGAPRPCPSLWGQPARSAPPGSRFTAAGSTRATSPGRSPGARSMGGGPAGCRERSPARRDPYQGWRFAYSAPFRPGREPQPGSVARPQTSPHRMERLRVQGGERGQLATRLVVRLERRSRSGKLRRTVRLGGCSL